MFNGAAAFNQALNSWNVAAVTDFGNMFKSATAFNSNITGWTTTAATDMSSMFDGATVFNQDISGFDFTGVTTMADFMTATAFSTANYDLLLVALDGQLLQSAVTLGVGTTTYTATNVDSGTTDGTTANKLVDSTQNFVTTVSTNDIARNGTDTTYAVVSAVDSNTVLSLSEDIMVSGEAYTIESSAAAKARASILLSDSWILTDGGPV